MELIKIVLLKNVETFSETYDMLEGSFVVPYVIIEIHVVATHEISCSVITSIHLSISSCFVIK